MQEITQNILDYIYYKNPANYQRRQYNLKLKKPKSEYDKNNIFYPQWHIGYGNNIKEIKQEYKNKSEIICEYCKVWSCKNKTQAKTVLKEIRTFGLTFCKTSPQSDIFIFLCLMKYFYKQYCAF